MEGWCAEAMRLIPRNETFFQLFVNQAKNIETAAGVLFELIDRFDDASAKAARMRDLEHEGDEMTHEIMRRLNTVFVTPFDHEDIHELTTTLDDVIDHMEAAADLFILYKIEAPLPGMRAQADVLVRASRTIREALETLPKYKLLSPTRSRSTGSRTRATGSTARPSRTCSAGIIVPWTSSSGGTSSTRWRRPSIASKTSRMSSRASR